MDRGNSFTSTAEKYIRRIVFPLVGLAGIVYEELQGDVDAALLGVYLSLVGLGAIPWARSMAGGKSGGPPSNRT